VLLRKFKVGDRVTHLRAEENFRNHGAPITYGVITELLPEPGPEFEPGFRYAIKWNMQDGTQWNCPYSEQWIVLAPFSEQPAEMFTKAQIDLAESNGYWLGRKEMAEETTTLNEDLAKGNRIAELKADHNRLTNELYHDRARLEKVISNAAELARELAEVTTEVLTEMFPGTVAPFNQNLIEMVILTAKLAQFAESNE
jgi:hypothetical protein